MTNETFDEKFPELVRWMTTDKTLGAVVRCSEVEKHCLDKQKVRDAINRHKEQIELHGEKHTLNDLLKELNLEEE